MKIEEYLNYTLLFDTYGKLLSNKQKEVMDKFLNLNLSESELASFTGESRQSVHDAVAKAKKQLEKFEEELHVVENMQKSKTELEKAKAFLKQNKTNDAIEIIDKVINNL